VICDMCGKPGVRTHKAARAYGRGAHLLVIEDIPVQTCPHCGGSYMTAETLHEIDRIKTHRKKLAVRRSMPVASFA
jgi:YgiT-type zinc finger domain-containing protein